MKTFERLLFDAEEGSVWVEQNAAKAAAARGRDEKLVLAALYWHTANEVAAVQRRVGACQKQAHHAAQQLTETKAHLAEARARLDAAHRKLAKASSRNWPYDGK